VWRLLDGEARIPVVSLATPFLFARRRRVEPAVVVAATLAVLVLALLAPFAIWAVVLGTGGWGVSRVLLVLINLFLLPAVLAQIASWIVWRRDHGNPRSDEDQQAFVDHVQVPRCDDALLVVRAPDDEAGMGLAMVQLGSLLTTRVLAIARPAGWERLVAALFVIAALAGLVSGGSLEEAAVAGVAVAVTGGVLLAYALVAVPTFFGLLHGLDGPTTWFFANVTAEATPPGSHRVVQRELRVLAPGEQPRVGLLARLVPWAPLQHSSLYDDPDVVREVIAHVTRRTSAQD
jgi:hypothetical protein